MLRLGLIKFLSARILQGEDLVTSKGENGMGEDLCDYCIRAVNCTPHYLRLSHQLCFDSIAGNKIDCEQSLSFPSVFLAIEQQAASGEASPFPPRLFPQFA